MRRSSLRHVVSMRTRALALPLALVLLALAVPTANGATVPAGFAETVVATGLANPTAMAFAPDGRLFVAEQGGRLRVIKNGALLADAVPHRHRQLLGRARAARRRLRSQLRDQPVRLRLLHGHDAERPQPRQPLHRERRRGGRGQRDRHPRPRPLSSAHQPQRRGDPLRRRRQALRRRRRQRQRRERADALEPARQDAAHQRRRLDPDRQPVLRHRDRRQPGDLGAGPAQPVHVRGPARHRPDVHQRRRPEHLGGDQRRRRGRELRLAGHRRATRPTRASARPSTATTMAGGRPERLRDHRRRLLQPAAARLPSRPRTTATTSSPTTASGWIYKLEQSNNTVAQFATGIPAPVDLKVSSDGALYYLARGAGSTTGTVTRISFANTPPAISTHPANRTVNVGQPAAFSVVASGATPLSYQWQRNGASIAGATSSTYTLASAQASDNGARFRVVVTNQFGTATSNEAVLTRRLERSADRHDHPADRRRALQRRPDDHLRRHGHGPPGRNTSSVGLHLGGRVSPRHPLASVHPANDRGHRRIVRRPDGGPPGSGRLVPDHPHGSRLRWPDPHGDPRRPPTCCPAHGYRESARPSSEGRRPTDDDASELRRRRRVSSGRWRQSHRRRLRAPTTRSRAGRTVARRCTRSRPRRRTRRTRRRTR